MRGLKKPLFVPYTEPLLPLAKVSPPNVLRLVTATVVLLVVAVSLAGEKAVVAAADAEFTAVGLKPFTVLPNLSS